MPHGGREEKNNDLTVSRESTSERVAASCAAAIDWGGMASPETHRHLWLLSNSSCLCNFARYLSISINTPVVRLSKFCVPAPSFRSTGGGGEQFFCGAFFLVFLSYVFVSFFVEGETNMDEFLFATRRKILRNVLGDIVRARWKS